MILYLEKEDLHHIFSLIYDHFSNIEDVPRYEQEIEGISKLVGIFQGVKQDFYPSIADKASYYLVQINKDHFFSNGNKRIALSCAYVFLVLNNVCFKAKPRKYFKEVISDLFPTYIDFEDDDKFSPEGFGLYNLSILIADSHKHVTSFDELKNKIVQFFTETTIPLRE